MLVTPAYADNHDLENVPVEVADGEAVVAETSVDIIFDYSKNVTVDGCADVPETHWAAEHVEYLVERGIIICYPDGTFRGEQPITRYEYATALAKFIRSLDEIVATELFADPEFVDTFGPFLAEALTDPEVREELRPLINEAIVEAAIEGDTHLEKALYQLLEGEFVPWDEFNQSQAEQDKRIRALEAHVGIGPAGVDGHDGYDGKDGRDGKVHHDYVDDDVDGKYSHDTTVYREKACTYVKWFNANGKNSYDIVNGTVLEMVSKPGWGFSINWGVAGDIRSVEMAVVHNGRVIYEASRVEYSKYFSFFEEAPAGEYLASLHVVATNGDTCTKTLNFALVR